MCKTLKGTFLTHLKVDYLAFLMKAWLKALQMLYKVWIPGLDFKALCKVY
jgi:hypothetical protein